MPPSTAYPVLALIGAVILWGSSFIAMKVALEVFHPLFLIWARMTIASLALLPFMPRFRMAGYRKGDWRPLVFMALCEPCLYFIFEVYALKNTSASQAGMISAILPLLVAAVAARVLHERIRPRTLAGFFLSILGVVLLTLAGEPTSSAPNPMLGNFLEFLAMCCATGYFITLKTLSDRYSAWFLTAVQAGIGALFFLPGLLLPDVLPTAAPAPGTWFLMLYIGLFIMVGAYALWNYGMGRLPANQASAFINLVPVVAVAVGWAVLGETFTPWQYAAAVLVLLGVWLSQGRAASAPGPAGA